MHRTAFPACHRRGDLARRLPGKKKFLALEHSLGKGHRTKTWNRVTAGHPILSVLLCGVHGEGASQEAGTQKEGDKERKDIGTAQH